MCPQSWGVSVRNWKLLSGSGLLAIVPECPNHITTDIKIISPLEYYPASGAAGVYGYGVECDGVMCECQGAGMILRPMYDPSAHIFCSN